MFPGSARCRASATDLAGDFTGANGDNPSLRAAAEHQQDVRLGARARHERQDSLDLRHATVPSALEFESPGVAASLHERGFCPLQGLLDLVERDAYGLTLLVERCRRHRV